MPVAADDADRAVVRAFERAVVIVYATLVVRLSYSGRFTKRQIWKNGVCFEWEWRPGLPWQRALEDQIAQIEAAAICVRPCGFGPRQEPELDARSGVSWSSAPARGFQCCSRTRRTSPGCRSSSMR